MMWIAIICCMDAEFPAPRVGPLEFVRYPAVVCLGRKKQKKQPTKQTNQLITAHLSITTFLENKCINIWKYKVQRSSRSKHLCLFGSKFQHG